DVGVLRERRRPRGGRPLPRAPRDGRLARDARVDRGRGRRGAAPLPPRRSLPPPPPPARSGPGPPRRDGGPDRAPPARRPLPPGARGVALPRRLVGRAPAARRRVPRRRARARPAARGPP